MTSGYSAVPLSKYIIATLFACTDLSDHSPAVLALTRALPDDLLCGHNVLGRVLPLCAAANDTQLMRRLWDIGAAGLNDSKIGWPGVKNPGTHYTLSKFMRERRPQGGGWQQMSLWLMQGSAGAAAVPDPGGSAALGAPPAAAGRGRGGRGRKHGR